MSDELPGNRYDLDVANGEIEQLKAKLAAAEAKNPMHQLTKSLQQDNDYAWGWHCNVAMSFFDEGATHEQANKAAARFMWTTFAIDVTQFEQWKSFWWAKKEVGNGVE